MSVTSGFFNSLSGDRKYDAIQISSMFDGLITDGIYNGFLESFMVTASSPASMVVTVGEGRCWFNHTWTLNDAPLPLTLDVGDVVLNRIDTVVIDVDSTDTVRACTIKVVKGTPSSQAVAPSLENTETHHQYPLCDISVVAGATTVTQSNITNRRGTSDCPFVATLMKSVNVDDLLIQWESQWDDWMTDRANSMDSWTAEQQEAFTTWFQTVQDTLDEDTAGNLYNLITNNTGINATATHAEGVVAITATGNPVNIVFLAPSDWAEADTYTYNDTPVELVDLLGEPVEDAWIKGSPVSLTITGGKAFFKNGGGRYKPTDLPPLNPNFTMEITEGDSEDTVTVTADKLIISPTTDMLAGGQWEYGTKMSPAPGKGQNIKHWTRDELVTISEEKDYSLLSSISPSDESNEVVIRIKENDNIRHEYIYLSSNYNSSGGCLVLRKEAPGQTCRFGQSSDNIDYSWISDQKEAIYSWANSSLPAKTQSLVIPVTISYSEIDVPDTKISSSSVLYFSLSSNELGVDGPEGGGMTGSTLSYFSSDSKRSIGQNYWTRDADEYYSGKSYAIAINSNGSRYTPNASGTFILFRPAFVLSPNTPVVEYESGIYDVEPDYSTMLEASRSEVIEEYIQLKNIPVSTAQNATILQIPENQAGGEISYQPFIYLFGNAYNSGAGYLLRQKCISGTITPNTPSYGGNQEEKINSYVMEILPHNVRSYLKNVSLPTKGDNDAQKQLDLSCCSPCCRELGETYSGYYGDIPAYFNSLSKAVTSSDDSGGSNVQYITRDAFGGKPVALNTSGSTVNVESTKPCYVRPAIMLDSECWFTKSVDGRYTFVGVNPDKQISFSFTVPHGTQPVVRQYTYNYEEHYQTMLEGGVLPALGGDTGPTYSEVLAENTWAQIAQAVADKDPILDVWQIGDTKDEVIAGETLTFAIMGKNMDDLADGSGKAGLTFGMTQLMASTRQMNSSNTNSGSFAGSAMYSWLSGTIYPNLTTELKDAIKAVNKKTSSGGGSSVIRTDAMYLWLFSEIEVSGKTTYSYAGEGTQYPYFATAAERIKRLSNGAGAASYWWERSPYENFSAGFCRVMPSGEADAFGTASGSFGVCFGFCI